MANPPCIVFVGARILRVIVTIYAENALANRWGTDIAK
jgi:hypothetical protein